MSTSYAGPLGLVARGLDELAAISPQFRSTGEKQEVLVALSRCIARARAEQLPPRLAHPPPPQRQDQLHQTAIGR